MRNTEPKLATRADRTSKIRPEVARLQPMRLVWRMDAGLVFSSVQGLHTGGNIIVWIALFRYQRGK